MNTAVPTALLAGGALAAVAVTAIAARVAPRSAFVGWACVLFFVPVWVGFTAGAFFAALTLATIFLIVVNWSMVQLRAGDLWIIAFSAVAVGLYGLRTVSLSALMIAMLEWIIPYVWGRVLLARVSTVWVTQVIASVAVVAGGMAIVEFAFGWNPFVLIPGAGEAYSTWSPLQQRGGVLRAEGAFGHSIALGASLAMSTAFIVASRWRPWVRILAVATVGVAAALTFSRAGIITLVFTLILSTFLLPGVSRRFRVLFSVAMLGAAALVLPLLDSVFGTAEDDLAASGGYRGDLLVLLSQVELFGGSGRWESLVIGDHYLGNFSQTIDNALLLILLRVGWVPAVLLLAAMGCAVVAASRRRTRNPAALAVLGQLPSLVVVALITQYGMFLWFCVGLAIAWNDARQTEGHEPGTTSRAVNGERAEVLLDET